MSVNIVRKPSETPNISIPDDCRMFHYATGGYDGFVPGYLEECGYSVSGRNFTVKSGELIVDGYQVGIDLAGALITAISSTSTYYYTVYLELDLQVASSPVATVKASYSLSDYPVLSPGDNLTENPNGIHRIVLYRFTAANGEISNIVKVVSACPYASNEFSSIRSSINTINSNISGISSSISTINTRLNNLGFRSATAQIRACRYSSGSGEYIGVGTAYFYRLGRFVLCRLLISSGSTSQYDYPWLVVPMDNTLKTYFLRGSYSGVTPSTTYDIGGKGTITTSSTRLLCYDKLTLAGSASSTNFLLSQGTKCTTAFLNGTAIESYATMRQLDVTLGWVGIAIE